MRILLSLVVLASLVSCGAGLDSVSPDIGNSDGVVTPPIPTSDPMPSLPAAIEEIVSTNIDQYFYLSAGTAASRVKNTFNYGLVWPLEKTQALIILSF